MKPPRRNGAEAFFKLLVPAAILLASCSGENQADAPEPYPFENALELPRPLDPVQPGSSVEWDQSQASSAEELIKAALGFRLWARSSLAAALSEFGDGLESGLPPSLDLSSPLWSGIVGTSILISLGEFTDRPLVAYYNPIFDSLLVTRWQRGESSPYIDAVALTTGGALLGADPEAPLWTLSKIPLIPARLSDACIRVTEHLREIYSSAGHAASEQPLIEPNADSFLDVADAMALAISESWAHLRGLPTSLDRLNLAIETLRSGDGAALRPLVSPESPFDPDALRFLSPLALSDQEIQLVLRDRETETFHVVTTSSVFTDIVCYFQTRAAAPPALIGVFSLTADYRSLFEAPEASHP